MLNNFGVYNRVSEQFSRMDTYIYPFQELLCFLKQYECQPLDDATKRHFDSFIIQFLDEVSHKYRLSEKERSLFKLNYDLQVDTRVSCANLFTACLLYGCYVPLEFITDVNEYVFDNGDKVEYNQEQQEYIYYKSPIHINNALFHTGEPLQGGALPEAD